MTIWVSPITGAMIGAEWVWSENSLVIDLILIRFVFDFND